MGWMDKLKQTAEKAAAEAGDMAAIGKLNLEIRTLHGKVADAFADEIKAKEAQIEQLEAAGSS